MVSDNNLFERSSFISEPIWCRNCGEVLKYFQYSKNSDFLSTTEEEINKKESLAKEEFERKHNLNCKEGKKHEDLIEFSKKLQEKLAEMPSKKIELEATFDEDITSMEEIIRKGFFKQLINFTYLHFRQKLPYELFPYAVSYVNFGGFEESSNRN